MRACSSFTCKSNVALLIDARGNCPLLADEHLAQLVPDLFHLFFRNLAAGHLRVLRLGIVNELIKPCLVTGLFEKLFNLLVGDVWWRSGSQRFEIVLRYDDRPNQFKLSLNLRTIGDYLLLYGKRTVRFGSFNVDRNRPRLFGNRQQLAQVFRETLPRASRRWPDACETVATDPQQSAPCLPLKG